MVKDKLETSVVNITVLGAALFEALATDSLLGNLVAGHHFGQEGHRGGQTSAGRICTCLYIGLKFDQHSCLSVTFLNLTTPVNGT